MLSNTRLKGTLASCRIIILLIGFLGAFSAFCIDDSNIKLAKPDLIFPDISYRDGQDQVRQLQQDLGTLTIVHFWATWCAPCVAELPAIDAMQKAYAKRGLRVIAISEDGEHNIFTVKDFFVGHSIDTLATYVDINREGLRKARIRGLPTSYFIDANSRVIATAEGEVDWQSKTTRDFLEEHLKHANTGIIQSGTTSY